MANASQPQIALEWRTDLLVAPRNLYGRPGYLVEDPLSGRFHRLGPLEFLTLRSLSLENPPLAAATSASAELRAPPLSEESLAALIRWAITNELLQVFEVETAPQLTGAAGDKQQTKPQVAGLKKNITPTAPKSGAPFDPFAFRVPLGSPDRWLTILAPLCGWLFSRHVAVLAVFASVWLMIQLGAEWSKFTASLSSLWLPRQQFWLFACWLLLKVLHEAAHGIACLRYGGRIREAGLSINFGAPLPYIDVTSSWRFDSRWERIAVAAAGMYIEWLVAICAGVFWLLNDDPITQRCCAYIITVAAAGTVLFNANPLVRFDGYYILSDLLDYPNLATRAQQWWRQSWNRVGWGLPGEINFAVGESIGLAAYGLLSVVWRWCTLLALAIAAVEFYEGFGIAMVALAAFLWFGRSVTQTFQAAVRLCQTGGRGALRPALIVAGIAAVCLLTISLVPTPFAPHLWGVARHAGEVDVRTTASGRVEEIYIRDGDSVAAGQLLAVLSNDELLLELTELQAEIARGEVRARQSQQQREVLRWQVELEHLSGLREQLAKKQAAADGLRIHAPQAGTVFAPRLQELLGRFLKEGDPICALGSPLQKEVLIAIPQDRLPEFVSQTPAEVLVSVPGQSEIRGAIERVNPRASTEPQDWSLATTNGGPLPVRQMQQEDAKGPEWQLLSPHFTATVILAEEDGSHLAAGQRCRIVKADASTTLGEWLFDQCEAWTQRHRAMR